MSGTGEEVFGPPDPTLREPLPPGEQGNLGGGEEFYPELQGPGLEDRSPGNMRPGDEQFYGAGDDLEQFSQLITSMDPAAAKRSAALEKGYQKALADDNRPLAAAYQDQQIVQAKISQVRVDLAGLDPAMRAPNNAVPNIQVEVQRIMDLAIRRQDQADMILDKHGWKAELEDWFETDVLVPYRERNQAQLQVSTEGMDPMQKLLAEEQLEPLVMDPLLVAEKRAKLAQIDAELELIHPGMSVFSMGSTKRVAGWINREASLGGGYIQSGEVEGVGFLGEMGTEVSANVMAGLESAAEFPLQLVYGGMNLVGATPPTNYVEGPNGEIITNAGKIPNITETWIAVAARLQGQNVALRLAEHGQLSNVERSRLTMVQQMTRGVSSVMGMGVGFGMAAGKSMQLGQKAAARLTTNGLVNLAASGSVRTARVLQVMSSGAGAMVGNGLAEGLAFGRHEGYLKAMWGGAMIAPVLMAFGVAGNRTEALLKSRTKMPAFMRRGVGGGVEGMGFGVMEEIHTGALWEFMKEPTEERWLTYAKNVIGMAIFKAARGRGALEAGGADQSMGEALQRTRGAFRRAFARNVAGAEAKSRTTDQVIADNKKKAEERQEAEAESAVPGESRLPRFDERGPEGEQIKGTRPSPETQMEQAKRGELEEGEIVSNKEVSSKRTRSEAQQGRDPLEDPDFKSRPEGERRALVDMEGARERRKAAEAFEGPEKRAQAAAEERVRLAKEEVGFPEAEELARLRKEGPTDENRKRIIELLQRARGAFFNKVGETFGKLKEQLPTDEWARKPTQRTEPRETDEGRTIAENQQIAREAGVDYELIRELGEELKAVDDLAMPAEERQKALDRIKMLEENLDTQEVLADPDFNPQLKAEIEERRLEALEAREDAPQYPGEARATEAGPVDPRAANPYYGERYGPGSMRAGANPYRQQESKALDKELDIMVSEIFQIMEGKQDRPGIRIGKWRIGARKGSAVQIAMKAGHMGRLRALGVFKIFENLVRNKEGQDLVVGLHEWSHAMHRQIYAGKGGIAFWDAVSKQWNDLPINAKLDVLDILRDYPGMQNLTKKELMAEAWAEWHSRFILGDPNVTELHPHLSREFLKFLNDPANRAFRDGQYRDLRVALERWKDMGARRRVGLTLRREGRKPKTYDPRPVSDLVERTVRAFFDDNIALKNSQERWLKRSDIDLETLSIMMDPSRMIDTVQMTAQKEAESFMLKGPHDLAFRRRHGIEAYGDIMKDVAGEGRVLDRNARVIDFVDLLYATRAIAKIDKGKQMPLPKVDYVRASAEILEANPHLAGKMEAMKEWSDSLLDLLVEAGQVGAKDAQKMKDEGMVYIPFVRMIEGTVSRFHGGRGVAEQGSGLKAFRSGSRDELMDPVKAMEDVTRNMIVKARKQMVVRAMYRLMLETDVGGLVTQVPKDNVPAKYRLDQVMRQMKKGLGKEVEKRLEEESMEELTAEELEETFGIFAELVRDNELSETLITLFGQKDMPFGEKDPIMAYVPRLTEAEITAMPNPIARTQARENNGKMIWLQMDAPAFEAFMGIDAPISRMVIDSPVVNALFRKPAQLLRFFATDANPAFAMSNLLRDAASVSVFNRSGKFSPFAGWIMAAQGAALQIRHGSRITEMWDRMSGGEGNPVNRALWEMFDASGASTSSFFNEGTRRVMRGQTRGNMQKIGGLLDSWKRMIAAPESWIRVAESARIVKKGLGEHFEVDKIGIEHIEDAPLEVMTEISYEALEGAREITVNFARGGDIARAYNQMTPYFTATLAGQRRMMRALLGQEGKTDAEKLRLQMTAWANGFVGITLPTMGAWMMVKDEDWYKDLPEWRKRHFINMKLPGTNDILSLPLPFELGTIFGSIPMGFADQATDGNPIDMLDTMKGALFPYFEHTSSWIPAVVKPTLESITGYDLFRERDLTPFWVSKTNRAEDQMRAGTTVSSQKLFQWLPPLQWAFDNPIELEQWMGGHTAGSTTVLMKAIDEITGLKDHPGIKSGFGPLNSFYNRFMRQKEHSASRTVDELYKEAKRLEQTPSGERTPGERSRLTRINRAKEEFSRLRRERELGRMDRTAVDRRMFEISNQIMGSVK